MKEIPLTQGKVALVDDEDYEWLMKWKWCYHKLPLKKTGYAMRNKIMPNGKWGIIRMHRIILNTPPEHETDHINGNGLDNRKDNLRVATRTQNKCNRGKQRDNTSGYKGVGWNKETGKWVAQICLNNKRIHLGYFIDKTKAAMAYNTAAIKLHGEFAYLNLIDN